MSCIRTSSRAGKTSRCCVAVCSVLLVGAIGDAEALPASTRDARAIMKAVNARALGDRSSLRLRMVIKDPSGSRRTRVVRSRGLDFKGGRRQLLLFESPADVRNTGLLTVDYDDGNRVDDQWLYLPSLRKSTRISSSNKSGSFMGSDLSFSDMTRNAPDQYDFKMIKQSARAGGDDCWLLESRARTERTKEETGYVKSWVWVSKSKLMVMQAKHWVREGRKIKLLKLAGIRKIGDIWFAHKIMARTLQNKRVLSTTIISFSDVKFNNPQVSEKDFTQRRLEQGL